MSQVGHSGPASPDPDETGSIQSRPESRTSISSESIGLGDSSRITSTLDDTESRVSSEAEKKNGKMMSAEDVIALDENAQSGGLLEEKNQLNRSKERLKKSEKAFDSLELVSDEDMETGDSFRGDGQNRKEEKLQSDFPLTFKDNELDFEGDPVFDEASKTNDQPEKTSTVKRDEDSDEGECDEGTRDSATNKKKVEEEEGEEEKDPEELEEGEVSSDEDVGKHTRMEPRPVCRFYSKGNCTWGSNCRFVHPGVLDKGNYNMFAPARPAHSNGPPPFDRPPFERPPHGAPPPDWVGMPSRPGPRMGAREKGGEPGPREPESAESAWERGLRQAKEMLKKSNQRKETDVDFEEKRLNLGLGEEDIDKENDYYTRPASPVQKERPIVDDMDVEPYPKYPPPPMERRIPGRYPPHLPPPGYPPPFEPRRGYGDPEFRDYYRGDPYDRPPFYGQKRGERDYEGPYHPPGKLPPPPPPEKRWQDERYVEVNQASVHRGRADEWHDPWMRSKSPPAGPGARGPRHRSYSSGSSVSGSSSSSGSSSYSSSSRSSSRSSFSSRSGSRSRSRSPTPRGGAAVRSHHASRKGKRVERSRKSASADEPPKSSSAYRPKPSAPPGRPVSPADNYVSRKAPPAERMRGPPERSPPQRSRSWSSRSSRSRSRSPPPPASRQSQKRPPSGAKPQSRPRSISRSSSSSSFDSSSDSDREGRRKRGRRDFAERKELHGSAGRPPQPPLPPGNPPSFKSSSRGNVASDSVKEAKQQIKLTLKSSAPALKRVPNKFADESDEEAAASRDKDKAAVAQTNPSTSSASAGGTPYRKRSAESPPEPPPSKVSAASSSPAKASDKDKSKKASASAAVPASRREELLKQLRAVEDAIARKRQKI